jgi:hypothetical protein
VPTLDMKFSSNEELLTHGVPLHPAVCAMVSVWCLGDT